MQNLANQYTKFITYKRRIFYTDFNTLPGQTAWLELLELPRTVEVVSVKIHTRTRLAPTQNATSQFYIHDDASKPNGFSANGAYAILNMNPGAGNTSGNAVWASNRINTVVSSVARLIPDMVNSYKMWLGLSMQSGNNLSTITAGEWDIWLTTVKRP